MTVVAHAARGGVGHGGDRCPQDDDDEECSEVGAECPEVGANDDHDDADDDCPEVGAANGTDPANTEECRG